MGLGEGRGWEPSTHCPRAWGTLCAHRGGSHTHECGSPRKVSPRLLANFASCRPPTAQGMEPGSCHGKCHGETWPLRPRLGAVGGAGKMELLRTSWFGGWCEARGGRAPAHTDTRAHGGAHTRALGRVREPTPSRPGTPRCSPPLVTAPAGWAGTRRQLPGLERRRRVPERCGSWSAAGQGRASWVAQLRATGCGV